MKQELYAFWPYDRFPFIVGGTVIQMNDKGYVETIEYGRGHWFKPCKLLPLEVGKNLHAQLKKLTDYHGDAIEEFNSLWLKKIKEIFPWDFKST